MDVLGECGRPVTIQVSEMLYEEKTHLCLLYLYFCSGYFNIHNHVFDNCTVKPADFNRGYFNVHL